ncbi:MAG: host attachment protein [Pseudomonadota bacterium]
MDTRELDNPRAHEQGRDKPGRAPTPSGGRAAFDAGDPREKAQTHFVQDVAEHIEAQAKVGAFDHLVLIAPSQWLARFRKTAPEAAKRILAEDAADVTKAPLKDLEHRIERLIKPTL